MPTLTLKGKYRIDESLPLSARELKDIYLFGIEIRDQSGKTFSDESFEYYIKSATNELERALNIKIPLQTYVENLSFDYNHWLKWNYIRTTYPVVKPVQLMGFIGTYKQVEFPPEWLSSRRTSDGKLYHNHIYTVPAYGTLQSNNVVYAGIMPHLGYLGMRDIPNYWYAKYCTGFEVIPEDLFDAVAKLASINIMAVGGDLVLGAGIASYSISADGLSQSVQTTQSAENSAFSARIRQYQKQLQKDIPKLKDFYRGFAFGVA